MLSPDKSVDILTSIKLAIAAWRVIKNVSREFQNSFSVLTLASASDGQRLRLHRSDSGHAKPSKPSVYLSINAPS